MGEIDRSGWRFAGAAAALLALSAAGASVGHGPDPEPAVPGAPSHCRHEILVQDPSGARVPEAWVQLTGPVDKRGRTDAEGRFCVDASRSGRYAVVVEKTGFEKASRVFNFNEAASRHSVEIRPAAVRQAIDVVATPELAAESVERIPGSLLETPRSVSVVDANDLRERNFRNVHELLAFVPGMAPNSLRAGGYHFYARGFRMLPEDTRVDGATGINMGGGFSAPTFGIEQVVLLKGPAGLLYGPASSPGGMINLITKKPQPVRSTQLDFRGAAIPGQGLSFGDRLSGMFDLDSTGAVTRDARLQYRTLFTAENQRYFTSNVLDRNRYARGSLLYRLDRNGLFSVMPLFQYGSMIRPAGGGIVISPSTSLSANDGLTGPIATHDLSPHRVNLSAGQQRYYTSQAGFDFRAVPSAAWTANFNYRWLRNDRHINQWAPAVSTAQQISLLVQQNEVLRQQSKSDNRNRHHVFDFNTGYEWRGKGWRTLNQVGAFTRVVGVANTSLAGTAPAAAWPLHFYTGAQRLGAPTDVYPRILFGPFTRTTTWNGFWQNRTWLLDDRLVLSLGLGYGQVHPGGQPVRKGDVIPNYAALYRLRSNLAVYYSYSRSFNPVDPTLEDIQGRRNVFDPVRGYNHEAGLKFDLPSRRSTATISYFNIGIDNALVQSGVNDFNVNGIRYYQPAGTRRGRGIESSVETRLHHDLFFQAGAAWTNAWYTGAGPSSAASTLAIPGSRAERTPRWSWNSRLLYERSEGRLAGWSASLALLYQGGRFGSNGARTFTAPDPLWLPAYTRFDASLGYRLNRHWDWALTCENLTDRRIWINATTGASMEQAPPRSATMRLSYRF
ncbi:MAG: TonB-dependent receptor [Bryobacteraceae bacterium]|nr:TonB-dependent receptor [Bryobacteraceae bacterium]